MTHEVGKKLYENKKEPTYEDIREVATTYYRKGKAYYDKWKIDSAISEYQKAIETMNNAEISYPENANNIIKVREYYIQAKKKAESYTIEGIMAGIKERKKNDNNKITIIISKKNMRKNFKLVEEKIL
jgi:tetratricopeptide (TPR) repeat protein